MTTTIQITRERQYNRGAGFAWKWIYHLPERLMPCGERMVSVRPGGFSTKTETLDVVRGTYSERPLLIEWPDGKTTTIKR